MRTDSTSISKEAIGPIKEIISEKFGEQYFEVHQFINKKGNTQEAHECIRPTKPNYNEIEGTQDEKRLYSMIWKRTIQSQMKPAIYQCLIIEIKIKDKKDVLEPYKLVGTLENLIFEGYLIVDEKKGNPKIEKDNLQKLSWLEINAIEDVAKIAHEELLRMLEINNKMIQYQNRSNSTDQNSSGISVMNINLLVNSRKENLNPANVSAEARNPGSKNGQSESTNQASIQPQAPQNINTDSLLYHDLQQDDQDILRLEPAPKTCFTEKFKRGTDPKKKEQMDAMCKKRDALLNDNSENLSQMIKIKL